MVSAWIRRLLDTLLHPAVLATSNRLHQLGSSVKLTSSTVAWHTCFTPSSIDCMFNSVFSLSSEWLFIGVTSLTAASLRPMLPAAPLCKSPSAHRDTTPSHQVRPSGVFCCRPDNLELAARLSRDREDTFRRSLKTFFFVLERVSDVCVMRSIYFLLS